MGFFLYNIGIDETMKKQNLTGQVDGEATTFTISEPYKAGTLRVYYNGIRQIVNVTFTEASSTTFETTFIPQTGEYIAVEYTPV
jgi:hypothetical protein